MKPPVIDVDDPEYAGPGDRLGSLDYEALLAEGDPDFQRACSDEDAIALNYTSGTTGDPKGVVFHHRGAYIAALGNNVVWECHGTCISGPPMFHRNGWCFPGRSRLWPPPASAFGRSTPQ